jgi:hypothetical protein
VSGLPCSSRSGGPSPPCLRKMSASRVRTHLGSKPSNKPASFGSAGDAVGAGRAVCASVPVGGETSSVPKVAAATVINCLRSRSTASLSKNHYVELLLVEPIADDRNRSMAKSELTLGDRCDGTGRAHVRRLLAANRNA